MNFYYDAANVLERLDAKKGSIKGGIGSLPEKSRKRSAALILETLKCATPSLSVISNQLYPCVQIKRHYLALLKTHL